MHCEECGMDDHDELLETQFAFMPRASMKIEERRYATLFTQCISKIPGTAAPISLETTIRLRKRGTLPGVVGLTTFLLDGFKSKRGRVSGGAHTVTFYSGLMSQLTDKAAMAVMAHELAHAWLNEHVQPEASDQREEDADILAEMWGFGPELEALASETEPVNC